MNCEALVLVRLLPKDILREIHRFVYTTYRLNHKEKISIVLKDLKDKTSVLKLKLNDKKEYQQDLTSIGNSPKHYTIYFIITCQFSDSTCTRKFWNMTTLWVEDKHFKYYHFYKDIFPYMVKRIFEDELYCDSIDKLPELFP
jgi:hypothetical protein